MTDRQEELYILYMSGVKTSEIAKRYGINRATAMRTIYRAEKHIRRVDALKRRLAEAQKGMQSGKDIGD